MTYQIKWHPQALKILKKLPKSTISRVLNKFDKISSDPHRFAEHFEGSDLFKIRIGSYRALIEILKNEKLVLVQVFDQRGKVYKNLNN